MVNQDVRPSPIAGQWYPGDAAVLTRMVTGYMQADDAIATPEAPLVGVLAPHAGMRFSGPVAGKAFRYTQGMMVDTVVIISPSHHLFPAGIISTAHSHYATPLGQVAVAHDLLDQLAKEIDILPVTNDPEHGIEIELPFLQHTLGSFELLPIAMIDQSWAIAKRLGELLPPLLAGRQALLVASSDLSHFYTQQQAHQLDQVVLDAEANYDPAAVIAADEAGSGFACGRGAIASVMVAAQQMGATTAHIAGYATSGDVNGDMRRVVGYGAALFS